MSKLSTIYGCNPSNCWAGLIPQGVLKLLPSFMIIYQLLSSELSYHASNPPPFINSEKEGLVSSAFKQDPTPTPSPHFRSPRLCLDAVRTLCVKQDVAPAQSFRNSLLSIVFHGFKATPRPAMVLMEYIILPRQSS